MPRVHLVRHGRPEATFSQAPDAGLDRTGLEQAEAAADRLAALGPMDIVVSPLRRARETAAPLERRWMRSGRIEPALGEIPSPMSEPAERGVWLRGVVARRWRDVEAGVQAWRQAVLASLAQMPDHAVVFSHFVAINVAVGEATGDDRVTTFSPDHCSVTAIDVADGTLRLVERGAEAATRVL
jgi:broad specificity phosphatase PhoE